MEGFWEDLGDVFGRIVGGIFGRMCEDIWKVFGRIWGRLLDGFGVMFG